MKKSILTIALPLAALLMQSCSEDDFQEPSRVDSGANIRFGAMLDYNPVTRTWYGDETTQDGKQVWPINWNPETNPDHIFVYSPEALEGRKQGVYTVHPNTENPVLAANITVDTESGVQASDAATYNFYAVYPASAVKGTATGSAISGSVPFEQKVTLVDENKNPITIPASATADAKYVTAPDMTNCLMIANEADVTLNEESPVTLKFKPFSSVLDITIPGTSEQNIITGSNVCYVTAIRIIATDEADNPVPISGDFTYDFASGAFTFDETTSYNEIKVSTMGMNENGDITGIPLVNNSSLRLQAFILPNPAVKKLKVRVISADSQVWTKTLNMTHFQPKQIHKMELPTLTLESNATFNFANWIGQLDPRIYISELSLPGSTSSFSYDKTNVETADQMQELTLEEQFKAGIRVFRCHVWLYDEPSDVQGDGGSTSFWINVNGGKKIMRMADAVRALHRLMQTSHSDGFCVLMVADYETKSGVTDNNITDDDVTANGAGSKYELFYRRFADITRAMSRNGYLPDKDITPNTTVADVKGKIILKLQLNANGGDRGFRTTVAQNVARPEDVGGGLGSSDLNSLLAKIQSWSYVNNSETLLNWWTPRNGSALFYAPMTYGEVGGFTYTNFSGGVFNQTRGTVTPNVPNDPGLASQAAKMIVDNATWGYVLYSARDVWKGNCNVTTKPANINSDTNKMWYIYGAQSDAGNNYSDALGLISQATNAIKNCYLETGDPHNKFFMTYLGGKGNTDYSLNTISTNFVNQWFSNIGYDYDSKEDSKTWGNRPYGWVLFNSVPAEGAIGLNDVQQRIQLGVRKVVMQNNQYTLNRNRSAASPNGDSKGIANGPSLF